MGRRKPPPPRAKPRARLRLLDAILALPVITAGALFVVVALLSLAWPIEHDAPCMAYVGFLIGHEG